MANILKDGERIHHHTDGRAFHIKVDGTEEEIVRDGGRVRVPMIMMDSAQRAAAAAAAVHKPKVDIALVDMSAHRPGFVAARVTPLPASTADAANAASSFADMVQRKAEAWKYTK